MMEFVEVKTEEDCRIVDSLLTELIRFESDIDKTINKSFVVKDYYKNVINKKYNKICVYAKEEDEAIGYIYAYLKNPIDSVTLTNIICLDALFVKEKYRNKKVGKKLLEMVEYWAKENYEKYAIEVTAINNNSRAIKFYEDFGFKIIRTTFRK